MPLNRSEFDKELEGLEGLGEEDYFGFRAIKLTVKYEYPMELEMKNRIGQQRGGSCYHQYCFGWEFPWSVYYIKQIDKKYNKKNCSVVFNMTLMPTGEPHESAEEELEFILQRFKPGKVVYDDDIGEVVVRQIRGKTIEWALDSDY